MAVSKSVRKVVMQSMKKDLQWLEERGPVQSRAFAGQKPSAQMIMTPEGRMSETKWIEKIMQRSWEMQCAVHDATVTRARARIARYAAAK